MSLLWFRNYMHDAQVMAFQVIRHPGSAGFSQFGALHRPPIMHAPVVLTRRKATNNNEEGESKQAKSKRVNQPNVDGKQELPISKKGRESNSDKSKGGGKEQTTARKGGEPKGNIKKKQGENKGPSKKTPSKIKNVGDAKDDRSLLNMLDPFKAGKELRKQIDSALTSLGTGLGGKSSRSSAYYLDDRFMESGQGPALFAERNPLFDRLEDDDYVPEVLVVGATGEVGRLVVRRLLLDGRFRVRVLVRDLYSKTLNMLGTGVTYCQGDLGNIESLEYAITDVDKIVFCAGAPRSDEDDFRGKFQNFVDENIEKQPKEPTNDDTKESEGTARESVMGNADLDWDKVETVMEMRARLAEQVDCIGMQHLVRAYQDVRYADYGTSQAAKRSLFKFKSRQDDFNIFSIDDEDERDILDTLKAGIVEASANSQFSARAAKDTMTRSYGQDNSYDMETKDYEDGYGYEEYDQAYDAVTSNVPDVPSKSVAWVTPAMQTQCSWIKNKFGSAVFVGKVPAGTSTKRGEAAVVSSRLRGKEDPEKGIDLSNGFAGFVCRLCSDGGAYEAFVRTKEYDKSGIEYVCKFKTGMKPRQLDNKSRYKFRTVRLPFSLFKAVQRRGITVPTDVDDPGVINFAGKDVRHIGFRYRSASNEKRSTAFRINGKKTKDKAAYSSFYLALSYIKVYRSQLEPEFVYLSDARIPPTVSDGAVRHDMRQILSPTSPQIEEDDENVGESYRIMDQEEVKRIVEDRMGRSEEETYFKFRGEEILRNSGLSYTIVRIAGYNESPSGESSTIQLQQSNDELASVSRADIAEVCVSSLLDPNALNKSVYMTKAKRGKSTKLNIDEDITSKFERLEADLH
eukprot:scaffold42286_cov51-Attheya_sp.AAC.7